MPFRFLALSALAVTLLAPLPSYGQSTQARSTREHCEIIVQNYDHFDSVAECIKQVKTGTQQWCQYVVQANKDGHYPDGMIYKNMGDCMAMNKAP